MGARLFRVLGGDTEVERAIGGRIEQILSRMEGRSGGDHEDIRRHARYSYGQNILVVDRRAAAAQCTGRPDLDRPGDWRVSIIGSQANDRWEMKIIGPNAFERSYTLEGSSREHRPEMIRVLLGKVVPRSAQRSNGTLFK